jgi:hypothetical protein
MKKLCILLVLVICVYHNARFKKRKVVCFVTDGSGLLIGLIFLDARLLKVGMILVHCSTTVVTKQPALRKTQEGSEPGCIES